MERRRRSACHARTHTRTHSLYTALHSSLICDGICAVATAAKASPFDVEAAARPDMMHSSERDVASLPRHTRARTRTGAARARQCNDTTVLVKRHSLCRLRARRKARSHDDTVYATHDHDTRGSHFARLKVRRTACVRALNAACANEFHRRRRRRSRLVSHKPDDKHSRIHTRRSH